MSCDGIDATQALSGAAVVEEERVRHSELVNVNAVRLMQHLQEVGLGASDGTLSLPEESSASRDGSSFACCSSGADNLELSFISDLPAEVVDALSRYVKEFTDDTDQTRDRMRTFQEQCERDTERAEAIVGKIERVRSEVKYMSEKSSADLQTFRTHLQHSGQWVKEHTRVIADLSRQQDKAEFEIRRTQMEIARLQKMARRIR